MKRFAARTLSVMTGVMIICCSLFIGEPNRFDISASAETLESQKYTIDFNEYKLTENTWEQGDPNAAGHGGYAWNIREEGGNKYLEVNIRAKTDFSSAARLSAKLQCGVEDGSCVYAEMKPGAAYKINFKYRVKDKTVLSDRDLALILTNFNSAATAWADVFPLSAMASDKAVLIPALENTENGDWVEYSTVFTAKDSFAVSNPQLSVQLVPTKKNDPETRANLWSQQLANGGFGEFSFAVDSIVITRLPQIAIHKVSESGIEKTVVHGNVGDIVPLDGNFTYYMSYDADTQKFSDKIDTSDFRFTDTDLVNIYYLDPTFEKQNYHFPFDGYDTSANTWSSNDTYKWETVGSGGNEYLKFSTTANNDFSSKARCKIKLQSGGEYIELKNNASYNISLKYRVKNKNLGINNSGVLSKEIGLALTNFSSSQSGSNAFPLSEGNKDIIPLVSALENTEGDGWVTVSLRFVTPEKFNVESPKACLFLYTHKAGNDSVFQNVFTGGTEANGGENFGSFEVDIDDLVITRTSKIELMDKDRLIGTEYIAPDEVLSLEDIENPEKSGHEFIGWFTDEKCSIAAGETITGINRNVTAILYAGWTIAEGSTQIILDTNADFAQEIEPVTGKAGDRAYLPIPVAEGHRFSGWYFDKELTEPCGAVYYPDADETLTLYAAWDKEPPLTKMDFENVPYYNVANNGDNAISKKYMSIADDDCLNGEKAFKYSYKGGDKRNTQAINTFALYMGDYTDEATSYVEMENGVSYIISFWYNSKKQSSDVGIAPVITGCQWNIYAQPIVHFTDNSYVIKKETAGTGWQRGVIYFTAEFTKSEKYHNTLFLRLTPRADEDTLIYFDDIEVEKLSESTKFITLVTTPAESQILTAEAGAQVILPSPVREGFVFDGWYSESEYTNKISGNRFTAEKNTTIYAKWKLQTAVCDFEEYPAAWSGEPYAFSKDKGMELSKNGSMALHYIYDIKNPLSNEYGFAQIYNKNNVTSTGDMPISVEPSTPYRVTFRYDAKELDKDVKLEIITANSKNFWANRAVQATYNVSCTDAGKGWKSAEIYFETPDKFLGKPGKSGNAIFIRINKGGDITDIYVDDFTIESLEGKSVIEFVPSNGQKSVYTTGAPGENINFPETPKRDNYTFGYWCTDEACKQRFNGKVFGNASLKLYAKWIMNNVVKISFEDDFYQYQLNESKHLDTSEISSDVSSDGKYSLKLNKADITRINAGIILVAGEAPVTVDKGETYVITYDYYIVKEPEKNTTTPYPNVFTGGRSNYWTDRVIPSRTWSMPKNQEYGVWKTASLMFTANNKNDLADVLYFTINETHGYIMYFDNLRLSRVERNGGYVLNLNPAGATSIGNTKLTYSAKAGEKIQLPDDIKRDGYVFTGWYFDQNGLTKVDSNYIMPDMDTTLYAGWSVKTIKQDFEDYYTIYEANNYKERLYNMDADYEIAHSEEKSDLIYEGKSALHRIGNIFNNCAAQIITEDLRITANINQVYKVTMQVKLNSGRHTDGAIKLASCNAPNYAWGIDGEWKNICAISDLADNNWHEISFTYYSTAKYLSLMIPGYLDISIDNIILELIENGTAEDCSESVAVKEYIPAVESGEKLIVDSDIDERYIKSVILTDADSAFFEKYRVLIIIIPSVVLAAAVIATVLLIRRSRKGKIKNA